MATYRGYSFFYEPHPDLTDENRERFHLLDFDASTRAFVDWALDHPQATSVTRLRDVAYQTVDFYDANAIADAYHMRTLSQDQWGVLLSQHWSDQKSERSLSRGAASNSSDQKSEHSLSRNAASNSSDKKSERSLSRSAASNSSDKKSERSLSRSAASNSSDKKNERSLLDVGAGDGNVTAQLAAHFGQVLATETSGPMVARLRERGWDARQLDLVKEPIFDRTFDLVAVQNVIDRTARPQTLVHSLAPLCKPDGLICLLVPLPLKPVVFQKGGAAKPLETIPTGDNWGNSANLLISWLQTQGLHTVTLSRAPYLCRGDVHKPLIALDDAVLLCRPMTVPLVGI